MPESVSPALARRIALAAQGFGRPRPASVGTRQLNGVIDRLGLLQLDSVNVYERSHYQPVFARLGGYDKALLDRLTFPTRGGYVEYWAHEAAVIPVDTWSSWRWRMEDYRAYFAGRDSWAAANPQMLEWLMQRARGQRSDGGECDRARLERAPRAVVGLVRREARARGAVPPGRRRLGRSHAVRAHLRPAAAGAAGRGHRRVVPRHEAHVQLVERAAPRTASAPRRTSPTTTGSSAPTRKAAIAELEEAGTLVPVSVDGWRSPAWLHRDARLPRRVQAAALLSPFDPVVWERARTERMFGFHYRIEIYTPAEKRIFGYYSLPILLDDALVGRIDLKNDRQAKVLRVQSAWLEEGVPAASVPEIAARVAAVLRRDHGVAGPRLDRPSSGAAR